MSKGIVMEITDKSIIVMKPDGKFDRLPRKKRSCRVGEEIVYAEPAAGLRRPAIAVRTALAAAVVFCIVLFASLNSQSGTAEVVAYVSMDINPSVEMGIDIQENVVELRGLNPEGETLIQTVDYEGRTIENVTLNLLDQAEELLVAQGEAEIVIASAVVKKNSTLSDMELAEKLRKQVTRHIEQAHPSQAAAYKVAAFAAPQEVREAAAQQGLSMGKYSVYLNAKSNGSEVTLEELKNKSVLNISKEKPEVARLIQPDRLPTKDAIKQLAEEEKSGELDKKLLEQRKKSLDSGKKTVNGKAEDVKSGYSGDRKNESKDEDKKGKNDGGNTKDDDKDVKDNDRKDNKVSPVTSTTEEGKSASKNDGKDVSRGSGSKDESKPQGNSSGKEIDGKNKGDDQNGGNHGVKDGKQAPPSGIRSGSSGNSGGNGNTGNTERNSSPAGTSAKDKENENSRKKEEERRVNEEAKRSQEQKPKSEAERKVEETAPKKSGDAPKGKEKEPEKEDTKKNESQPKQEREKKKE